MLQEDIDPVPISLMFEAKLTFCAKAQGGNGAVSLQVLFCIAVPGHALIAIVIQIEQTGIIGFTALFFCKLLQRFQGRRPGQCPLYRAGLRVFKGLLAVPGYLPLGDKMLSHDKGLIVPPLDPGHQLIHKLVRLGRFQHPSIILHNAVFVQ